MRAPFLRVAAATCVWLLASCGHSSRDPLQQAKRDYAAARFDAALTDLENFKATPTGESLDLRGCILMEQGKFDDAIKAFDEAHAVEPALFGPRLHRGDAFLRQAKYDDARREYQPLLAETNILISHERLLYATLISFLAEQNDTDAAATLEKIKFPTESPAYYYAQAAWAFSHNDRKRADEWIAKADAIYDPAARSWFARPLFDLGWTRKKPPLVYSLSSS